MGTRPDDVVILGDCDENVRKMAGEFGWAEELKELWRGFDSPKYVKGLAPLPYYSLSTADQY